MFDIYEYCPEKIDVETSQSIHDWSCGLWWDEWEDSGIEKIYLVYLEDDVVAFQTVNSDNETIAIEVKENYKGKGLAKMLLEESGSWQPERNENPEFWEWAKTFYENNYE